MAWRRKRHCHGRIHTCSLARSSSIVCGCPQRGGSVHVNGRGQNGGRGNRGPGRDQSKCSGGRNDRGIKLEFFDVLLGSSHELFPCTVGRHGGGCLRPRGVGRH